MPFQQIINNSALLPLTIHARNDSFIYQPTMKSEIFDFDDHFSHTTISEQNFQNVPPVTLMCLLEIPNDLESLSLILHAKNRHFIHQL